MSLVPRFNYPTGTEITLFSRNFALNGLTRVGYEVTDYESGAARVISYAQWVEYLKMPGRQVQEVRYPYTDAQLRLDGYASAAQLPDWCQEYARFHLALCSGMQVLRDFQEAIGRSRLRSLHSEDE